MVEGLRTETMDEHAILSLNCAISPGKAALLRSPADKSDSAQITVKQSHTLLPGLYSKSVQALTSPRCVGLGRIDQLRPAQSRQCGSGLLITGAEQGWLQYGISLSAVSLRGAPLV